MVGSSVNVRRSRLSVVGAALAAAVLVSGAGLAAEPTLSPSPEQVADAPTADPAARGTHCIECYLFWDPNADANAVLGVPVAVAGPAWLSIDLAGPDGASFRLADFAGRPVLVELMATWCASCVEQQDALRSARADLPADTVIVSLDVDPATDPASLAGYAAVHGYDWLFATSPRELSRSLLDAFGEHVLDPAASPVVVIDRDGTARLAPLGHKDPAAIVGLFADG